jgi:uncharacterized GH25 family protein
MRKLLLVLLPLLAAIGLTWYFASHRDPSGAPPAALGPKQAAVGAAAPAESAEQASESASERVESEAPPLVSAASKASGSAVGPAQPAPRTTVSGRIVDNAGRGIASAELRWKQAGRFFFLGRGTEPPAPLEAKTDAEGRFRFETERTGEARLLVSAARFAPHSQIVVLQGSGEQSLGVITLARGVVISGSVVDLGGNPVEGAEIHRPRELEDAFFRLAGNPAGELLATTDAQGAFEVDRQAVGPWSLIVTSVDHPDASMQGETTVPDEAVRDLLVRLQDGDSIRGRIRGLPEGASERYYVQAREDTPMAGPSKAVLDGEVPASRTADPAADGSFELRGLFVGKSYRLVLLADDPKDPSPSRSASVVARSGDSGVELVYSKGTTLVFQVVDARTGSPVTDFEVEAGLDWLTALADPNGQPVRSHPDGLVRFEGLRPRGSQKAGRLVVDAVGYERYEQADIPFAHEGEVDLGRIALASMPVVRVLVRASKTGEPIAGARVELLARTEPEPTQGGTRTRRVRVAPGADSGQAPHVQETGVTDENGLARLRSLPGERVQVSVRGAAGYAPWKSAETVLAAGEDGEFDALLTRGGGVRVLALDSEGTPLSGIGVRHRTSGEAAPTMLAIGGRPPSDATTDANGAALFDNLGAGRHLFQLDEQRGGGGGDIFTFAMDGAEQDETGWTEAFVAEDEVTELVLHASARGRLVGRVTQGGAALAGAKLTLEEKGPAGGMGLVLPGTSGPTTKSDGEGRFQFDDVAVGKYSLLVDHVSRAMEESFDVSIESGENVKEIELSVAMVEGRVLDEKGEAVPGARVTLERVTRGGPVGRLAVAFRLAGDDDAGGGAMIIGGVGADKRATTDAEGRFVLRGVPSGIELRVSVQHDAYQPASSESLQVARDEVKRDVDVKLELGGMAEVTVRRADGAGASMAIVKASFEGQSETQIQPVMEVTDKEGKTVFRGLREGSWRIEVVSTGPGAPDDTEKPSQSVTVETGKTVQVALDL